MSMFDFASMVQRIHIMTVQAQLFITAGSDGPPPLLIEECRHLAKGCVLNCVAIFYMSGRNNVRYKYYRICFDIHLERQFNVK